MDNYKHFPRTTVFCCSIHNQSTSRATNERTQEDDHQHSLDGHEYFLFIDHFFFFSNIHSQSETISWQVIRLGRGPPPSQVMKAIRMEEEFFLLVQINAVDLIIRQF